MRHQITQFIGVPVSAVLLQADVCRADLMVEIEASVGHTIPITTRGTVMIHHPSQGALVAFPLTCLPVLGIPSEKPLREVGASLTTPYFPYYPGSDQPLAYVPHFPYLIFYAVAPQYATTDRPAFATEVSYASSLFLMAVSKRHSKSWLGVFARLDSLRGAVFADSPLVERDYTFSVCMRFPRNLVFQG